MCYYVVPAQTVLRIQPCLFCPVPAPSKFSLSAHTEHSFLYEMIQRELRHCIFIFKGNKKNDCEKSCKHGILLLKTKQTKPERTDILEVIEQAGEGFLGELSLQG